MTTHPDLAAQWSDLLNAGGPGVLTTGSHVKAWWRCPTDPRHLWRSMISNRVNGRTGCPYCAHTRPTPTTSLAGVAPHLLGDWHPTRNSALSPTDVLHHTGTPVWSQCPDGHEWAASPANRLTGTGHGCPDCAARNRPPAAASPPDRPSNRPRELAEDSSPARPQPDRPRPDRQRPTGPPPAEHRAARADRGLLG